MRKSRHLSVQLKILIVFVAIFLFMFLFMNYFAMTHYLLVFEELEKNEIQKQMVQTESALKNRIDETSYIAKDWANRDEVYDFLLGNEVNFVEGNIGVDTFDRLGVNSIILMDNNGEIIWGESSDIVQGELTTLCIEDELAKNIQRMVQVDFDQEDITIKNEFDGMMTFDGDIAIVSVKQVFGSDNSRVSPGYLIFAKKLDDEFVTKLSTDLVTDIMIETTNTSVMDKKDSIILGENTDYQMSYAEINQEKFEGYLEIEGFGNKDYILITVDMPRYIVIKGRETAQIIRWIIPIIQAIVLGSLLFVIRKIVLSKLRFINHEMEVVTSSRRVDRRIEYDLSNDELKDLSDNINKMLDSNESLYNKVEIINEELEQKVQERTKELELEVLERKKIQEEVTFMAYHDSLTSLPNRSLFEDRGEQAIARSKRNRTSFAILYIDLDGFKEINDSLGHAIGDELLILVGQRLVDVIRKNDTVSRVGGDEFVLLIDEFDEYENLEVITDKIIEIFRDPFVLAGQSSYMTCSMGVSIYPDNGLDIETLLKRADDAMYRAKSLGKNRYVIDK